MKRETKKEALKEVKLEIRIEVKKGAKTPAERHRERRKRLKQEPGQEEYKINENVQGKLADEQQKERVEEEHKILTMIRLVLHRQIKIIKI